MSTISFSVETLRKIIRLNFFPFNENNLLIFGIRAGLPKNLTTCSEFRSEHFLDAQNINFLNPKCTIGIFDPLENKMALFPGSTVPHLDYMKKQKASPSAKISNSIMSGYYSYYGKGTHSPSIANAHEALRLMTNVFLRRTTNDLVFDNSDLIDVSNPNDNIHAAYCDTINGNYSSAGCQVIVGQPKCVRRGANSSNTVYWKKFHDIIYGNLQSQFDYMLLRFQDAEAVSQLNGQLSARLRFGSNGYKVKELQEKLAQQGYYQSNKDGKFLKDTLLAVYEFQKKKFGLLNADGVVGNQTASVLNLQLPLF